MKHTLALLLAKTNPLGPIDPPTTAFSNGAGTDATGVVAAQYLETFISNAIGALTIIGGLFFIFYFVMGALNWITAGGDTGKITKARDQMIQGVTGMIVIVISYGLMGLVGSFLGLDLLHPAKIFLDILKGPTG